jgi:hypothetical protein
VLTALGSDNSTFYQGSVRPAPSSGGDPNDAGDRAVFDVPPGRVRLRMSIENMTSRAIDSDVREIAIRDLRGPVALGTPEVLRARTARALRAIEADPNAVPVASREFSRTERLVLRVPVYVPDGAQAQVSARLLGRSGQALSSLPVKAIDSDQSRWQIEAPLAAFAPGEYFIEIAATSPAGDVKELLSFRVTN